MWWCVAGIVAAIVLWPPTPAPVPTRPDPPSAAVSRARGRSRWPRRRRVEATRLREAVLEMLEQIAPALAAGVAPGVAVSTCAELASAAMPPGTARTDVARLAVVARHGGELGDEWQRLADRYDVAALGDVAQAWALCETLGCGLHDALQTATGLLREQARRDQAVREATAGPRATMQLLTLLPVAGVGLCALMGISPLALYSGGLLLFAFAPGCVLLIVGRILVRRMIRTAGTPTVIS